MTDQQQLLEHKHDCWEAVVDDHLLLQITDQAFQQRLRDYFEIRLFWRPTELQRLDVHTEIRQVETWLRLAHKREPGVTLMPLPCCESQAEASKEQESASP